MKIVFTTNEKPLSKLARYLSEEDVSHIGIIFDCLPMDIAFDCSTSGFKVRSAIRFQRENKIIYCYDVKMSKEDEFSCIAHVLCSCVGRKYDFNAYYWMIIRGIIRKFFKIGKPKVNPWSKIDRYLCTEVLDPCRGYLFSYGIDFSDYDFSAMTPKEIYKELCYRGLSEKKCRF